MNEVSLLLRAMLGGPVSFADFHVFTVQVRKTCCMSVYPQERFLQREHTHTAMNADADTHRLHVNLSPERDRLLVTCHPMPSTRSRADSVLASKASSFK